jgi:hypothetical protein
MNKSSSVFSPTTARELIVCVQLLPQVHSGADPVGLNNSSRDDLLRVFTGQTVVANSAPIPLMAGAFHCGGQHSPSIAAEVNLFTAI